MTELLTGGAVLVVGQGLALIALHLRLRAGLRVERLRGRAVLNIAQALPQGRRLYDQRADGTWLVLEHAGDGVRLGGSDE